MNRIVSIPMIAQKGKLVPHFFILALLIYFVVFIKLNAFHMRWWDESMFAVNTYEMLHNGKFFTLYFNSIPDLYNTKPPLVIWMQVLCAKIVGYNELAIRLPSAIATALSVFLLFRFMATRFNVIWAWLSALILLTSPGFIGFHTARTGDSDSLLTFLLLAANLSFLNYLYDHSKKHIFFFFLFLSFAFATKMFAALLFTPAYAILLIREKQLRSFIVNYSFLSGVMLFAFVSIALICFREQQAPGYFHTVIFSDAGRVFQTSESIRQPFSYYLENLFQIHFSTWFIPLVIGCGLAFYNEHQEEKRVLLYFTSLLLVYLSVITFSKTKLSWYDLPLYPCFAVVAAYPLYLLLQKLPLTSYKQVWILVILIYLYPYYIQFENSQANRLTPLEKVMEANERYLFERENQHRNLNGIHVYYTGYNRGLFFYKYKLADKGQSIQLNTNGIFQVNDKVLVCNEDLKSLLSKRYLYDSIDSYNQALLVQIKQKKED